MKITIKKKYNFYLIRTENKLFKKQGKDNSFTGERAAQRLKGEQKLVTHILKVHLTMWEVSTNY